MIQTQVKEVDCQCGGTLILKSNNNYECARCSSCFSSLRVNEAWLKQFKESEGIKKILSEAFI